MSRPAAALSLYRSILRAHSNYLPPQMRQLGDVYVKNEFRQHRGVTNLDQLGQFFSAWKAYLDQVQHTGRARGAVSTGVLDDRSEASTAPGIGANVSGIAAEEEGVALSSTTLNFGTNLPEGSDLSEDQVQRLEQLRRNVSLDSSSLPVEDQSEADEAAPVIEHWKAK